MMSFNLSGTDWFFWFSQKELGSLYATAQHYPPFVYVAIAPLTMFSPLVGYLLLILLSLTVMYLYVGSIPKLLLVALCFPVTFAIAHGNVDALLTLAFMLPTQFAALVVACKPQALVVWWMRSWLVHKQWKDIIPIVVVLLLSLAIWGWWPAKLGGDALSTRFLISKWWFCTAPLGIVLLYSEEPFLWMIAGVLLVPYLQVYHLTPILVYLYKKCNIWVATGITILSWAIGIVVWS